MKKITLNTTLYLLLILSLSGFSDKEEFITVEINYGKIKAAETITVEYVDSMTALEALQHAAEVKTHPVAKLVFVVSINGVEGIRGDKAWYYTLNGKEPKLAITQEVNAGDTISWRFVKDVCSSTVDCKKK